MTLITAVTMSAILLSGFVDVKLAFCLFHVESSDYLNVIQYI